jgi:hypothetical protein
MPTVDRPQRAKVALRGPCKTNTDLGPGIHLAKHYQDLR